MQKSTEGSAPHADSGFPWDAGWIYEELGFCFYCLFFWSRGFSLVSVHQEPGSTSDKQDGSLVIFKTGIE